MRNGTQRDKYGGTKALQFEASGFFRLEKADRWWLVTPEGNAFLCFGINHMEPGRTTAPYNKEFWAREFGVPVDAELPAFFPGVLEKAKKDIALLGMNTLGCHTPPFYGESFMPYVAQIRCVDICHYMVPTNEDYHDVFAQDFVDLCEEKARAVALPRKDDPYLLGYSMTDCPIFTNLDAAPRIENVYGSRRPGLPLWPVVLRNLDASAPGKQAYVATVRERYRGDIRTFNNVYEVEDDLQFLYRIVDRCYEVEVAAIRKFDTNHLIFGDKLNGNSNTPDQLVRLADKHMDLIFYQYYAFLEDQITLLERWTKLTDKAFFMGDSSLSVPSEHAPDPYGPHCRSQEDRAERSPECSMTSSHVPVTWVGTGVVGWTPGRISRTASSTAVCKRHSASSTNRCAKRWPNSRQACTPSPRDSRGFGLRSPAPAWTFRPYVRIGSWQPALPSGREDGHVGGGAGGVSTRVVDGHASR